MLLKYSAWANVLGYFSPLAACYCKERIVCSFGDECVGDPAAVGCDCVSWRKKERKRDHSPTDRPGWYIFYTLLTTSVLIMQPTTKHFFFFKTPDPRAHNASTCNALWAGTSKPAISTGENQCWNSCCQVCIAQSVERWLWESWGPPRSARAGSPWEV